MFVLIVAALLAASVQAASFSFKYSSAWFDEANWENATLPSAGSVVTFPQSFSTFGLSGCTSSIANQCRQGGVVSVSAPSDSDSASISLTKLELPHNGKMVFESDAIVTFFEVDTTKTTQWADRGPHQFDFNCAANWVITGTNSNPSFQIPCFNDTALFPSGTTYMTYVPSNTFVAQLNPPTSTSFADPAEFSGSPVVVSSTNCPEPYLTDAGLAYCPQICLNSCPELSPSNDTKAQQILQQDTTIANFVELAIQEISQIQANLTAAEVVTGIQAFSVPISASAANIETVRQNVVTLLPKSVSFPLAITCNKITGFINCTFTANIAQAKLPAFVTSLTAPYSFTPGLLGTLFDDVVFAWFQQQIALTTQSTAQSRSPNAASVAVQVPSDFVDALPPGATGITLFVTSLSAALPNLPASNIFDVNIFPSTSASAMIILINFIPASGVTTSSISALLTNVVSPFIVKLLDGTSVALYNATRDVVQPSSFALDVALVPIVNSALALALPVTAYSFTQSVQKFVNNTAAGLGSQVLFASPLPAPSARRSVGAVNLYLLVPHQSQLLSFLDGNFFIGFGYDNISSTTSNPTLLTLSQYEVALLSATAGWASTQATSQAGIAQTIQVSLSQFGAAADLLGTGTYSWSNVDIVRPNSGRRGLTNGDCQRFLAVNISQTQLKSELAANMASVLPVPVSGITFITPQLTCTSYYPFQTQPDQKAVFSIELTVTSLFTQFGSNSAYVVYNSPNLTHSLQPFEIGAPLNMANVQNALSDALRVIVLGALQQSLNTEIAANTPPTTATFNNQNAATAASFPILPIIAAGAGAAILVAIIIIVAVVRRRRSAPNPQSKNPRSVVAFENPMYDNNNRSATKGFEKSEGEGLYDEPAFNINSEKFNPIYDWHQDEFGAAIDALNTQGEYLYDESAPAAGFNLTSKMEDGEDQVVDYLQVGPEEAMYSSDAVISPDKHFGNNEQQEIYFDVAISETTKAGPNAEEVYLDVNQVPEQPTYDTIGQDIYEEIGFSDSKTVLGATVGSPDQKYDLPEQAGDGDYLYTTGFAIPEE